MIERDIHGWKCTPEDFANDVHWFTLQEMTSSLLLDAARIAGIDPMPNPHQVEALRQLCIHVLDPLRDGWNGPILINSGYRCPWINKMVGGVKNSQHTKGEAADIRPWDYGGMNNRMLNRRLLGLILYLGLPFDQLLAENCDDKGYPEWLHISFKSKLENRNQFLMNKKK